MHDVETAACQEEVGVKLVMNSHHPKAHLIKGWLSLVWQIQQIPDYYLENEIIADSEILWNLDLKVLSVSDCPCFKVDNSVTVFCKLA